MLRETAFKWGMVQIPFHVWVKSPGQNTVAHQRLGISQQFELVFHAIRFVGFKQAGVNARFEIDSK